MPLGVQRVPLHSCRAAGGALERARRCAIEVHAVLQAGFGASTRFWSEWSQHGFWTTRGWRSRAVCACKLHIAAPWLLEALLSSEWRSFGAALLNPARRRKCAQERVFSSRQSLIDYQKATRCVAWALVPGKSVGSGRERTVAQRARPGPGRRSEVSAAPCGARGGCPRYCAYRRRGHLTDLRAACSPPAPPCPRRGVACSHGCRQLGGQRLGGLVPGCT